MTTDHFGVRAIDVWFTNIRKALTGGRHADISWNAMPLNDGATTVACLLGHLRGRDHEEAGGLFLREEAIGGVLGTAG